MRQDMKGAAIAVGTMLVVQAMVSLSVLSLGVMMPAVAVDLAIDPKLVGVFTAIIYGVAATVALSSAGPVLRFGAVRVCQGALLMAAAGLAVNAAGYVFATVIAVVLIGVAQGPVNPASSHILALRTPREWFSFIFSVKQTGVPLGFALAGALLPFLLDMWGWRGATLAAAGGVVLVALLLEILRPGLDATADHAAPSPGIWRWVKFVMAHAQLRVLGLSALVYVSCQHTFSFFLVTYLYQHCSMSIAQAGFLLFLSQIVGTAVRLILGGIGDRVPRIALLGWTGLLMASGAVATALLPPDAPLWLVGLVVVAYGSIAISWNGVSMAEFAHLAPTGQVAAVAGVQIALAFSGAVIGPPLFGLIASAVSYRAAFLTIAATVLVAALWQLVASRRRPMVVL